MYRVGQRNNILLKKGRMLKKAAKIEVNEATVEVDEFGKIEVIRRDDPWVVCVILVGV